MLDGHDGSELCFPQLNTSCRKPNRPWSEAVFLHFLLRSVSLLTAALNLLVIVSISHFRHIQSPTNLLLLSLSVSDFLVGLVYFPGEILRKTSCWFLGDLMCILYLYFAMLSVSASVGNMVLISVDRHLAVCDPLHYPTRVTVGRVKLWIFLCWFCLTLYSSLFVIDELFHRDYISCYGECVFHIDYILAFIDVVVSFIIPVTVIVVLYVRVFVVAVSQARAIRSHVKTVTLQHSVTLTSRKSELKAARTLGVLVFVFLICFCPYYCVSLTGDSSLNTSSGILVLCLFSFNSCLNPVIYALFYPWFRRAVKLTITLQILQPGSCDTNFL